MKTETSLSATFMTPRSVINLASHTTTMTSSPVILTSSAITTTQGKGIRLSLRSSVGAHRAWIYPCFRSDQKYYYPPSAPAWDASPLQVIHLGVEGLLVKCLAKEQNALPRPRFEPRLLDPKSIALTIQSPHLHTQLIHLYVNQLPTNVLWLLELFWLSVSLSSIPCIQNNK